MCSHISPEVFNACQQLARELNDKPSDDLSKFTLMLLIKQLVPLKKCLLPMSLISLVGKLTLQLTSLKLIIYMIFLICAL